MLDSIANGHSLTSIREQSSIDSPK